jgi:tetratricopeptide (TPR) repeat protein
MRRGLRVHPGPRSLAAFIDDDLPPRRRAAIGRHLAVCSECRRQIAAAKDLMDQTGDSDPRGALGAWVDAFLAQIPDHRWPSIVADEERLQHVVVAQHLSARADDLYYRDPHAGLLYATTATVIYERLAASGRTVPPELRTAAWREQASFMLRCGRLSEYEQAIDRAYELANDADDPEYERAVLDLSRAIAFSEPDIGRLAEASALLEACTAVLDTRGDRRRSRIAALRRGDVFMAMSDLQSAAVVFKSLLVEAPDAERGQLVWRLGWCANESGRYAEALAMGYAARAMFADREERAEVAMGDWLIGEALSHTGRLVESIGALTSAESELSTLGMTHQWISVRLARVSAMLAADMPGEMVRELCAEAAEASLSLDHREPSRRHNCTAQALEFLRENAARESLTLGMVQYVAAYVRRASRRPVSRFMPPSGVAIM